MVKQVPYLNIFLSSPGDVAEERAIARKIMKRLPNRPTFKGRVALNIIAWDDLDSATAMEASLTPQAAINKGLPTPAESDIVIVIFWSRMGTPFTDEDGMKYQSGTHWELLNALTSKRTKTYIYRRMQKVSLDADAGDFHARYDQYQRVKDFFNSEMFFKDGQIKMSVHQYDTPADFEEMLDRNFEQVINEVLTAIETAVDNAPQVKAVPMDKPEIQQAETEAWPESRSPFPGLQAFTEKDAPIFFGRGRETDSLIQQVSASRFVAVVGASGSGKSSLVGAGLIPLLKANGIEGSKDWQIARLIPGENPFDSLYNALLSIFPQFKPNPMEARRIKQNFIADLRESPQTLHDICLTGLENLPAWAEVLLFVDQFEELFTLTNPDDAKTFAVMLDAIAKSERVRVVVTMRHDFFNKAVENQTLAELLRADAVFSLAIPKRDALRQMIERPAERAGLELENGLVERILNDTGDEPGNLALMAYALDELYKLSGDGMITNRDYDMLGGVQGAIGTRAENQFLALRIDDSVFQQVFHALVEVDERGTATRRREHFQPETLPDDVRKLIETFTNARLLTSNYDANNKTATVEVAHEAILRSWPRLSEWIENTQDDLRLLRQVRNATQEWDEKARPDFLLWPQERLELVYVMQERLKPELNEAEQAFIEAEQERLYRELQNIETKDQRRYDIGERLARIGDTREGIAVKDGKPDIIWLPVNGSNGKYKFKFGEFQVKDFFIAKYLTTVTQLQAFLDSDWDNPEWWKDFCEDNYVDKFENVTNGNSNAPRDTISWYQSVAFGRWMTEQFKGLELAHPSGTILRVGDSAQIRLPTEWEWQWAAMAATDEREYPWGDDWDTYPPRANTTESGINNHSTAVGMYPHGQAKCGALDIVGNLYEWCLNDYGDPTILDGFGNGESKVRRGGSFAFDWSYASSLFRYLGLAQSNYSDSGLRLVVGPIAPL